jgi:hypothetical protein
MEKITEAMRRTLQVSATDMQAVRQELLQRFVGFSVADPSGAAQTASEWIPRYREAAVRQHAAFIATWKRKDYTGALVELHFFLTAACKVIAFMRVAADRFGGDVKAHFDNRDFTGIKQARDHFEHIEDRLYGSKKNRLKSIKDKEGERTIHFGLRSADQHLTFSDRDVDVSEKFATEFDQFIARFLELVRVEVDEGRCDQGG